MYLLWGEASAVVIQYGSFSEPGKDAPCIQWSQSDGKDLRARSLSTDLITTSTILTGRSTGLDRLPPSLGCLILVPPPIQFRQRVSRSHEIGMVQKKLL